MNSKWKLTLGLLTHFVEFEQPSLKDTTSRSIDSPGSDTAVAPSGADTHSIPAGFDSTLDPTEMIEETKKINESGNATRPTSTVSNETFKGSSDTFDEMNNIHDLKINEKSAELKINIKVRIICLCVVQIYTHDQAQKLTIPHNYTHSPIVVFRCNTSNGQMDAQCLTCHGTMLYWERVLSLSLNT